MLLIKNNPALSSRKVDNVKEAPKAALPIPMIFRINEVIEMLVPVQEKHQAIREQGRNQEMTLLGAVAMRKNHGHRFFEHREGERTEESIVTNRITSMTAPFFMNRVKSFSRADDWLRTSHSR